MVNAMIGARYNVAGFIIGTTTTDVPPLVRTMSEDLACWFSIRGGYVQDGGRRQDYLDDYKNAVETLKEIRDGKQALLYTGGAVVPPVSASRYISNTEAYSHIFNMDDPENWAVDVDQVSDIGDTR